MEGAQEIEGFAPQRKSRDGLHVPENFIKIDRVAFYLMTENVDQDQNHWQTFLDVQDVFKIRKSQVSELAQFD
jgi:hypothetical protein